MAPSASSWAVALVALVALTAPLPEVSAGGVVGCYFGSWSGYRSGNGAFNPESIDPFLCTHLYYGFVGLTANGALKIDDEYNDLPSGNNFIARFNALKSKNPQLKTLASVGGWSQGSIEFSAVANNANLRQTFARNAANFCQQYGFNGIDVDWEFPADRGGAASDLQGYVLMLEALRAELSPRGLLLTAAVNVDSSRIGTGYDVTGLSRYLDLINLMTYDFHGTWDSVTGHNSPLYPSSADKSSYQRTQNVDAGIRNWIQAGAPANKIVLGMGTYGHSFTLANAGNHGMGAPATGAGAAGPVSGEAGTLAYYEICSNSAWKVVWDDNIKAPYAYNGNQWVGYDNAESVKIKAQYANSMGLAGAFIWSIDMDDFRNICGGGKYPLLSSIHNTLISNSKTTVTPATPTTSTTTRSPSTGSSCSSEGYMRDASNCSTYHYCQPNGQGGYIKYDFQCPNTLVYDTSINACNYRNNVSGC